MTRQHIKTRLLALCIALIGIPQSSATETVRVAVASNFHQTFKEIKSQFNQFNHSDIELIFGSSGNFARQIVQGAPFDIFISANKDFVDFLYEQKAGIIQSDAFARGKIAYFIPNGSMLYELESIQEIHTALRHSDFKRLAIANPKIAPYGIAARQALQAAGLWVIAESKLLLGESVAQAMQFALSGGVDLAVVPAAYEAGMQHQLKGRFIMIPESFHSPISQYIVLLNESNTPGPDFYDYLLSREVGDILKSYYYTPHSARN